MQTRVIMRLSAWVRLTDSLIIVSRLLLCAIATFAALNFASAEAPYAIEYADPLTDPWRISRFPELENRGVSCITEDLDGNIWMGMQEGVVKYDGYTWTEYGNDQGLPAVEVKSLTTLSSGELVAATQLGLYRKSGPNWSRIFPKDGRPAWDFSDTVIESKDGAIWACCTRGLVKLTSESSTLFTSEEFVGLFQDEQIFDTISPMPNKCLQQGDFDKGTGIEFEGNRVVVLSENSPARAAGLRLNDKVLTVNGSTFRTIEGLRDILGKRMELKIERFLTRERERIVFTTAAVSDTYRSPSMEILLEDSSGRIWAGGRGGVLTMSPDGGSTWRTWTKKDCAIQHRLHCVMESSDGKIWAFASRQANCAIYFDGQRWHDTHSTELGNSVTDAVQARDGSIWVSSQNKMHVLKNAVWRSHDARDVKIPSRAQRMLVANDESLWVVGKNQSVVRIAMSLDEFETLRGLTYQCTEQAGAQWFISSATQRVVRRDQRGAISYGVEDDVVSHPQGIMSVPNVGVVAMGAHNNVAAVASYDGEKWTRKSFPGVSEAFSNKSFAVGKNGRVWIGAKGKRARGQVGGVISGIDDDWQHFSPPDIPAYLGWILGLPDGRIMAGNSTGVWLCDGTRWSTVREPLLKKISCSAGTVDANGTVWLASRMNGVLKFQNDQWTSFTVEDGLSSNEVSTIHVDTRGSIWASTRNGLCRYDGERFIRIDFPEEFGRRSIQSEGNNGIWLDGIVRYGMDPNAPRALLDQSTLTVQSGAPAVISLHGVDKWNRTAANDIRWSWRTNDGQWSAFVKQNQITLESLSVGNHALEIRAIDGDANVSPTSKTVAISVLKPFWLQAWFLSAGAMLLALIAWLSASLIRRTFALRHSNRQLARAREDLANQFAEKSAQFRAICDCSPVGIFVVNTVNEVTYFNSYLADVAGMSGAPTSKSNWMESVYGEDRDSLLSTWWEAVNTGSQFRFSGRFRHRDGSVRRFNVVADRIQCDGQFLGYVGALDDVTDKLAAEQDLKESNLQLRDALDRLASAQEIAIKRERLSALGRMAAGVAHDINNSLTPLLTYAEMLEREAGLQGEPREWLKLIRLGVTDTAETVRRLEHYYRESHNREFLEIINLGEVVTQSVEMTRPRWQNDALSTGKRISVNTEFAAQPIVKGNGSQLRAVLTNIIFNAVDAIAGKGVITIRVDSDDNNAVVNVVDSGQGMSEEQLRHCTEPFYTSKPKGSGLGLSECDGIVRQHGGHLSVNSHLGKGTTVQFRVPRESESERMVDAACEIEREFNSDIDLDATRRRPSSLPKILCIDDDELVRQSTVALLQTLQLNVETAADGPAGLTRLEQEEFQLVLCDQGLPGMDGLTVLKHIKSRRPNLPVIMVSGWTPPQLEGVQPDGFLEKPFALADLAQLIETHLGCAKVS